MSYQRMDHAGWIERACKVTLNNFQKRVVDILGIAGGGIYNAPINPAKIDWTYGGDGVSVIWKNDMATWDGQSLTMLVFLCHLGRIRCDIKGAGPRQLRLSFWQRKEAGGIAERHPDITEAVAALEMYIPADHRIRFEYRDPLTNEEENP